MNKKVRFFIIVMIFPICIIVGKYIRYSFMKTILVDNGIGHNWIGLITSNMNFSEILRYSIAGEQNGTAILIYKYLNILHLNTYFSFELLISIIFNFIVFILFFKCRSKISIYQTIFILTTIILLNLFCFCLSKEPIQIVFFVLIFYVLLSSSNKKETLSLAIITLSAVFFRKYYILIVYFYIGAKLLFKFFNKNKEKKSIIKAMEIICLISVFYLVILIISKYFLPSYYYELIRVRTRISDASTIINNTFQTNNLLMFTFNYLLIVIRMLFPIELIPHGLKYIIYVFYQLLVTYTLIKSIINYKNNSQIKNISILIYIAFLFTSATFEPDFGSWIRHEVVLFPLLMIMNDIIPEKHIQENSLNNVVNITQDD